ncbi:unnamed protein product, partial [Linum tenue]
LQLAWDTGFRRVCVQIDSHCAVQLLQSTDSSDHHYMATISRFHELLKRDWEVSVNHVYREGNRCADFLADQGHNFSFGFHSFPISDPMLYHWILYDS